MKKSKYQEEEEQKMTRTHSKLSEKNDDEDEDNSGGEDEEEEDEEGVIKSQDLIVPSSLHYNCTVQSRKQLETVAEKERQDALH